MYNVKTEDGKAVLMTKQELIRWCRIDKYWDDNNELSDDYIIAEACSLGLVEPIKQFNTED